MYTDFDNLPARAYSECMSPDLIEKICETPLGETESALFNHLCEMGWNISEAFDMLEDCVIYEGPIDDYAYEWIEEQKFSELAESLLSLDRVKNHLYHSCNVQEVNKSLLLLWNGRD